MECHWGCCLVGKYFIQHGLTLRKRINRSRVRVRGLCDICVGGLCNRGVIVWLIDWIGRFVYRSTAHLSSRNAKQ